MRFPDLSGPERLLWEAFPRGAWVDLRAPVPAAGDLYGVTGGPSGGVIRAEVIRALLLGGGEVEPGCMPGVRLRGATISGRLDLMGAAVSWPLICEYCLFDSEPRFVESSTKTVRMVKSHLPGFNGTRMRLDGILNLWASVVDGVVRLDQAKVTGQVCLRDAAVSAPAGGTEAVAADGLTVDGGMECAGLNTRGSVSAEVAVITGSLDLTGARITCPGRPGLVTNNAVIGGRLHCRGMIVEGETQMRNCRIAASMIMSGVSLSNPAGTALNASGLTVDGGVFLTDGFTAVGGVRMIGARLGANLAMPGATLRNPGGIAVNLDRATIGIFHGPGVTCEGQISFKGTRIAQDLNLADAKLEGDETHPALVAEGMSVDGALILTRMRARGEISLRTVRVGQRVLLMGSQLESLSGTACRLSRAQITADMFCDEMTAAGTVRLAGATIGGELSFKQARLRNPAGIALAAPTLHARELSLRPAEPVQGLVDLSNAQIGIFRDDPGCWPGKLHLDGLTYQSLEPPLPARQRLQWIARDPRGHQPQPYEQLAAHYNAIGQPAEARTVLYVRERLRRQAKGPLARTWSLLQDVTVGYGYQPWRALAWLVLLLAAGTVIFSITPPPPLQAGTAPHFNPVIYTLDLLLPVVDLGQKHTFNPAGAEQWFSYLLAAAGWVLVTTIAAGTARVLSRR